MTFSFAPATKEQAKTADPRRFHIESERHVDRFMSRVHAVDSGCWEWTGTVMNAGYGSFSIGQQRYLAHRASLAFWAPALPIDGLQVDHLCRNKICVNPWHLEPVTQAVNLQRQGEAVTHCPRGHEYTPENTYRSLKQPTCRRCKTCARDRQRKDWGR